jgi:predicted glycogen debranching enzyme
MIALPGLALATGRPEIAIRILRTFARYVNQGMLPNRFPDQGEDPEYNTVDATLWYVEAVRATYKATGDKTLLQALYPVLEEIIDWHIKGTRFGIKTDVDGLLSAGEPGVQLTWMDAKVGDWVVTPRMGKPVEVNALWYNALRTMADLARGFGNDSRSEDYLARAELVKESFARFWNPEENCLFDVIDGPGEGETLQPDPTIRPNQLLAVSLHYSPLSDAQARAVLERCGRDLMTPFGLRSMAPSADGYEGHYGGDVWHRDAAYHQGTGWMWLIGPYLSAHWRIYKDADAVRDALKPLLDHLSVEGLGTISEIFDGDPPHAPRGCIAQAWSVAEVLRVWVEVGG